MLWIGWISKLFSQNIPGLRVKNNILDFSDFEVWKYCKPFYLFTGQLLFSRCSYRTVVGNDENHNCARYETIFQCWCPNWGDRKTNCTEPSQRQHDYRQDFHSSCSLLESRIKEPIGVNLERFWFWSAAKPIVLGSWIPGLYLIGNLTARYLSILDDVKV